MHFDENWHCFIRLISKDKEIRRKKVRTHVVFINNKIINFQKILYFCISFKNANIINNIS